MHINYKRLGSFNDFNAIDYLPRALLVVEEEEAPPVAIFYNLYTKSQAELPRVAKLVREQLSRLKGNSSYYGPIYIKSIGAVTDASMLQLFEDDGISSSSSSNHTTTGNPSVILEHFETGNESLSLHSLWEFCRRQDTHTDQKVAYLHSKGSFHDHDKNRRLRGYVTTGVLSKDCFDVPDSCNVCSPRMSPLPHPHTSGNMWLARCNYIAKLMDPFVFADAMWQFTGQEKAQTAAYGGACIGIRRFSQEHWVHSHPEIAPCDIDNSSSYTWAYHNIPEPDTYTLEVKAAPRYNLKHYERDGDGCSPYGFSQQDRIAEYLFLYRQFPPPTWFGWHLYANDTATQKSAQVNKG